MKIAMTSVFVPNPVEAHKFYTEILGFKSHTYMPEHYLAIVVSPEEEGGVMLLLEPNQNPIARTYQEAIYKSNLPVIIFSTDNIQAEYERLKALGVVFRKAPVKTDYGIETIFEDTCGNLIQLMQLP